MAHTIPSETRATIEYCRRVVAEMRWAREETRRLLCDAQETRVRATEVSCALAPATFADGARGVDQSARFLACKTDTETATDVASAYALELVPTLMRSTNRRGSLRRVSRRRHVLAATSIGPWVKAAAALTPTITTSLLRLRKARRLIRAHRYTRETTRRQRH
jgi:hypothetical protein